MEKGIIYLMTTIVPGLVKIGKTKDFEGRMRELEHNGYCNVTGLHREFAIEVDDYSKKETIVHDVFANSRVGKTELFALEVGVVIKLLTSLGGEIVFPRNTTEDEILNDIKETEDSKTIPSGTYYLKVSECSATVEIKNEEWIIKKGSKISLDTPRNDKARRKKMLLVLDAQGVVLEDCNLGICSPSNVGTIVLGYGCNGWTTWKNDKNQPIDIYKKEN